MFGVDFFGLPVMVVNMNSPPENIKQLIKKQYKWALGVVILLHGLLFFWLLFSFAQAPIGHAKQQPATSTALPAADIKKQANNNILQAHTISSAQVAQQIKVIKQERQAELQLRQQKLRTLQRATRVAASKRQRASSVLNKLQRQQQQARQKLAANQQQAAQLAQQQAKTKADLKLQRQSLQQLKQQAAAQLKTQQLAAAKAAQQKAALQAKAKAAQQKAAQLATVTQQRKLQGELNLYKSKILSAIASQWIVPANLDKNLSCQLFIRLDASGKVLAVKLLRSSGNVLLDRSARLAVFKASPLPLPTDPGLRRQFKELQLTVRPEDVLR